MVVGLHGSGVRFVSEQSIDTISSEFDRGLTPITYIPHLLQGSFPEASISLISERDSTGSSRKTTVHVDTEALSNFFKSLLPSAYDALDPRSIAKSELDIRTYFRIVDGVKPDELPSDDSLQALGNVMTAAPSPGNNSRIPAAFTYLGQFIAHDVTHMSNRGEVDDPINYRSHALDLDSIFGPLSEPCGASGTLRCHNGVCLGQTTGGRYEDLPRSNVGQPCTAEPRNDNTLAISQMTVAIIRFHHAVCKLSDTVDMDEQIRITQRHFQSIVLDDYCKSLCHPDVFSDIRNHGRLVLYPGKGTPSLFQIPVEFAAACFRMGHSQVRDAYDWSERHTPVSSSELRRFSYIGGQYRYGPLPDDWRIDWARLIAGHGASIDHHLDRDLHELPGRLADDPAILPNETFSLAKLTLRRGQSLKLPTAQMLIRHVQNKVSTTDPLRSQDSANCFNRIQNTYKTLPKPAMRDLEARTPLWLYTLLEAEDGDCNGEKIAGRHLGPLASRIVMETLHAAISAVPDNIISGSTFKASPDLKSTGDTSLFTFSDMIHAIRKAEN